mgnify:CR=1 FL=1
MEHKVCFLYKTRQEVWYIHKTKNIPSHGYIQEININIFKNLLFILFTSDNE